MNLILAWEGILFVYRHLTLEYVIYPSGRMIVGDSVMSFPSREEAFQWAFWNEKG